MHPSDMKELNIKDNDYVKIENVIHKKDKNEEEKKIEILALVINSENKYSKMTSSDLDVLSPREVGIDQTYPEALALTIGHKVILSQTNIRQHLKEKFLSFLNYQKAIVRIQANAPYMEHKTPVVCLCAEMISSIFEDRSK
jgi:hypothetical protein